MQEGLCKKFNRSILSKAKIFGKRKIRPNLTAELYLYSSNLTNFLDDNLGIKLIQICMGKANCIINLIQIICITINFILSIFQEKELKNDTKFIILFSIVWSMTILHIGIHLLDTILFLFKKYESKVILYVKQAISLLFFILEIILLAMTEDFNYRLVGAFLCLIGNTQLMIIMTALLIYFGLLLLLVILIVFKFLIFTVFEWIRKCGDCDDNIYSYYYEKGKYLRDSCAICFVPFEKNDIVLFLECHPSHIFHEGCILEWLNYKSECPLCKIKVDFT